MKTLNKLSVPVIQGGMGVGVSMGSLAGAVAAEGGMGVISTANIGFREENFWNEPRETDKVALAKEIKKAQEIAGGKGLIAINAMVATTNFQEMIEVACDCGIDAVIAGAGLPLELPAFTEGRDVLIAPIVSSGRAAQMIMKVWMKRHNRKPDFIVVEGSMAGGHLGFDQEQVSNGTTDSIYKITEDVVSIAGEIPVFAAGGIFDASDIKKCLEIGAKGVQIATRFIATKECDASQGFKNIIIGAKSEDVMILKSPVGMPGRGLKSPLMEKVAAGEKTPADVCIGCIHTCRPMTTPYCINEALINAFNGVWDKGLFFCGGNVGRINEMTTVHDLMEELKKGWE